LRGIFISAKRTYSSVRNTGYRLYWKERLQAAPIPLEAVEIRLDAPSQRLATPRWRPAHAVALEMVQTNSSGFSSGALPGKK
jgi:hypothetical protein